MTMGRDLRCHVSNPAWKSITLKTLSTIVNETALHHLRCFCRKCSPEQSYVIMIMILNMENTSFSKHTNKIRGREPGRSPRAEGEHMNADERKQHDCDHKVIARSFKNGHTHKIHTKLMHIEVFCNLSQSFAIIFLISFETLISNMRYIWLNCKMLINFNIFVDLAIIFSASLKQ